MKLLKISALLLFATLNFIATAQTLEPIARWSFDEKEGALVEESVTHTEIKIQGIYKRVAGVSGNALRFDGNTTALIQPAEKSPQLQDSFSVEAWIAFN